MIKTLRNNFWVYYIYTTILGFISSYRFRKVNTLVLFIGYPRSGSSTLGSLLDAHKNIIIAHEFNALKYIQKGFKPRQLFYLLAKNSKQFTSTGRISSGYSGIINGEFNGKAKPILIIGDKKAGATSKMIAENNKLLQRLKDFYPTIKLIHIVRNPFDMIATQAYSGNEKQLSVSPEYLDKTIEFYASKFLVIEKLISEGMFDSITIKHEQLLSNPENILKMLLDFLNVDDYNGYIDSCKNHLYSSPHKSRNKIKWTTEQIEKVQLLISNYSFLEGYRFED
jgi:hypothetical protein